jgi:hypothetical protein
VKQGDMPPWFYLPMHREARLTEAEKQALTDGAEKSGSQTASEALADRAFHGAF